MTRKSSSLTAAVKHAHAGSNARAVPAAPEDLAYQRRTYPIDLADIAIVDRFRSIDDATVKQLVVSIKASGLQTPILVRHNRELDPETGLYDGTDLGGYALVAGAHRLEAARELRWPRIEAFVLDELTADEVRLIELDENLMRAELTAFDRARSLGRRKELYERIYPETRQGGDRRSQEYLDSTNPQTLQSDLQTPGRAPSFVDDTATSTPWSPRTIQRAVRIAANIVPELQEALVATPIAQREGDLYRLAGMPEADQTQVLERIRETETPPKRLSAVLPDTPPPAAPATGLDRLKRLWSNASAQEQQEFRAWIDWHRDE